MANTWNRSGTTWGQGLWGEQDSNLIDLTGISASFSIGTAVAFSEQGWGRDDWGEEPWGESFDPVISVTGFGLTASLGDSEEFNETGWGRLTWGTADWDEAADELITPSGLEATSSLGTVVHVIGVPIEMIPNPPTGDQLLKIMRGQVGEITIGISQVLDGQQAEFATPTLSYVGTLVGWGRDAWGDNSWGESPNQVLSVVGVDATTSVGSISPADAVGLSGQESTTTLGTTTLQIDSTPT